MKSNKMKIMFFIFLTVLVVGIVLILIPFNSEKFVIASCDYDTFVNNNRSGFDATVCIDNKTNKIQENVSIEIEYTVEHMFDETTHSVTINNVALNPGENEIEFTYEINDFGIYSLGDIENVYINLSDGRCLTAEEDSFFTGPNWYFIGMIVIGFFGSFVSLVMWKVAPQIEKKFGNASESFTNFAERVKEAFKPLTEEKNEKEDKKYYCGYCKCTFDSKYDKCPHCGAPPERKD